MALLAEKLVRDVPDFPKPGIMFKDITPILQSPAAMREVIDALAADATKLQPDAICGIESRGFLFGVPVAMDLGVPFIMSRKFGKLPYERISEEYALEYGSSIVEMHIDAANPGHRVYVIDDLLATGGTARATARLIERLGGHVCGMGFVIELGFLEGRKNLDKYDISSLISYS
ncbi:MAG: adenine phosphoribosyltransferase [Fimbriimonadaceae bacterium]